MIEINNLNQQKPYVIFNEKYKNALSAGQKNIEAISISSFNKNMNEVNSRFVNLKYIINDEWIFFSNYLSKKSADFKLHDQIAVLIYWNSINVQIRIKAQVKKTSDSISDKHFHKRSKEKNSLAISSRQSEIIDSYESVLSNYKKVFKDANSLSNRPSYWGGYSFTPYYFEFWEGHQSRLNKRTAFSLTEEKWDSVILQP